jgi:uncharacterized membrane protein YccC
MIVIFINFVVITITIIDIVPLFLFLSLILFLSIFGYDNSNYSIALVFK